MIVIKKFGIQILFIWCEWEKIKNFLSEGVREHVIVKSTSELPQDIVSPDILAIKDKLAETLIPLEIKITKSKDSEKNKSKFLLFCTENLRIYNNINEYIKDVPALKNKQFKIRKRYFIIN